MEKYHGISSKQALIEKMKVIERCANKGACTPEDIKEIVYLESIRKLNV